MSRCYGNASLNDDPTVSVKKIVTDRNRDTCKFRVEVNACYNPRVIGIFTGEKIKFGIRITTRRRRGEREGERAEGMKHKRYRYYLQVFLYTAALRNAIDKLINGNFMQCQRSCVNILKSVSASGRTRRTDVARRE